jgi:hypothetical protein
MLIRGKGKKKIKVELRKCIKECLTPLLHPFLGKGKNKIKVELRKCIKECLT